MVAVEARVPDDPGRYVLQVTSPSTGVASVPQAVEVRRAPLVTSRDGAPFLSAAYDPRYNRQPFVVSSLHSFDLDLTAINTGSALWLSQAEGDNGRVDLGWRWLKEGRELGGLTGRTPIGYDVLPGQRYQFHLAVPPPEQPGTYTLELGLVSERVAWFSDAGTPPARLLVAVEGPTRSPLMTWLGQPRAQLPHAPRLATAAERIGDVSRLDVVATVPEGSWVVDAYLILEDPEGRLWLTDGQRLARPGDGLSLALVRGIVLSKGTLRTVLRMPIPSKAELRGGEWTWYLVLTEVDTDRIIAEATAPLRVRR